MFILFILHAGNVIKAEGLYSSEENAYFEVMEGEKYAITKIEVDRVIVYPILEDLKVRGTDEDFRKD